MELARLRCDVLPTEKNKRITSESMSWPSQPLGGHPGPEGNDGTNAGPMALIPTLWNSAEMAKVERLSVYTVEQALEDKGKTAGRRLVDVPVAPAPAPGGGPEAATTGRVKPPEVQ